MSLGLPGAALRRCESPKPLQEAIFAFEASARDAARLHRQLSNIGPHILNDTENKDLVERIHVHLVKAAEHFRKAAEGLEPKFMTEGAFVQEARSKAEESLGKAKAIYDELVARYVGIFFHVPQLNNCKCSQQDAGRLEYNTI